MDKKEYTELVSANEENERAKQTTNAGKTLSRIAKIRLRSLSNSTLSQGERKSAIPLSWERGRGEGNSSFAQQTETDLTSYRPNVLTTLDKLDCFARPADGGNGARNDVTTLVPQYPSALVPFKKAAFTLAEVLITLGIIGVVAAMTMPTLIQNHKKSVVETKLAKFYSVMNQAVQRAEADYGDKKNWDEWNDCVVDENLKKTCSPAWDYFNKYFAPYLNIVKTEEGGTTTQKKIVAYFSDGSVATFGSTSIQFWPNGKDFGYSLNEENGKIVNNMKASGRKYFTFLFKTTSDKGVEPYKYGWDGTREMLLNDNSIGCKETVTNERAYCAALIQMNGWKIPKDYPLRF